MLLLQILLFGLVPVMASRIPVKIVQTTSTPYVDASRAVTPTPHRPPNAFSGPTALKPLSTQCISTTASNYIYTVCPYANVTQKESSTTWSPFFGFLGIWDAWETELISGSPPQNNTVKYVRQLYTDGTLCGTKRRSLRLTIVCASGNEYGITDIKEPNTCEYSMTLSAPEACTAQFLEAGTPSAVSSASGGPQPSAVANPTASAPLSSSLLTVSPQPSVSQLPDVSPTIAPIPSAISVSASSEITEERKPDMICPTASSSASSEITVGATVSNVGGQVCAQLTAELDMLRVSLARMSELAAACPESDLYNIKARLPH